MTAPPDPDPDESLRLALERCWLLGRRLAQARRRIVGTLPTSPERLAGLGREGNERIDVFLFRLGAALSVFLEETVETVLLAEGDPYLPIRLTSDLRDLERLGAIPSADQVLDIQERVGRHYLIATLSSEALAAALNQAWADGEAMADLLAGVSRHILLKGLIPGLSPLGKEPP